jgi:MFS family permease
MNTTRRAGASEVDDVRAWLRLLRATALATIGGVGMWSVVVSLPAVETEFGAGRAGASLPYTVAMLGFAAGGVLMGRAADRFGIAIPLVVATACLSVGYVASGLAANLWQFTVVYGVLIGAFGSAAVFGPLVADISLWFSRRRGLAVALCASGNYLAGAFWPPVVQHFIAVAGWRQTQIGIGVFCATTMLPLALSLRRRSATRQPPSINPAQNRGCWALGWSSRTLQTILAVAGFACCVAMAMPQVHLVAYCGDLGYSPARGADMLSLMLGCGIVSRVASGSIADRVGGLATLLIGSFSQTLVLLLFLVFRDLTSLYVISALFGLFQGGIIPSYAIIVREYFPRQEAGARIGAVMMATLLGMAFGGWISGVIFDLAGSYQIAFVNGIAWNLLNVGIVALLLWRQGRVAIA